MLRFDNRIKRTENVKNSVLFLLYFIFRIYLVYKVGVCICFFACFIVNGESEAEVLGGDCERSLGDRVRSVGIHRLRPSYTRVIGYLYRFGRADMYLRSS